MLKDTDLYIIASALQQSYIDEYDEEMIDGIFENLRRRRKWILSDLQHTTRE